MADKAADCARLTHASGEYAKLAGNLASLRKTADAQKDGDDAAALAATQRKIVELARTISGKLHKLQVYLDDPVLSYVYERDATSFDDYANTLEGAIENGDLDGGNIHATMVYERNVRAVNAANDAYHEQCS
jgi:hypothetical protein